MLHDMDHKSVDPLLFIIFGATGDLSRRKLLPALCRIAQQAVLEQFVILGIGRSDKMNDQGFRAIVRGLVAAQHDDGSTAATRWCDCCVHYSNMGDSEERDFRQLSIEIESLEQRHGLPGNRVFYLALPPQSFTTTIEGIGTSGLNRSRGWTRLVVEKPFGTDLASARQLDARIHEFFDESQVFRIDHYLGKETVQNLLILRFANPVFEHVWNRDRVDNVQITVAEELGVERRTAYYDQIGALRDMVQNHLTQILTFIAMEVPVAFESGPIHDEKVKVLRSVTPLNPDHVVFGQYTAGRRDGQTVPGYTEEQGVASNSKSETAVALKLEVANWRWHGVPFYLRTGKRLARRVGKIVINFRCAPVSVFAPFGSPCSVRNNVLELTIQPDESFDLHFEVKEPGQPVTLKTEKLGFHYAQAFHPIPDAYETLLLDIMLGDQTLFVRSDWMEWSWRLYDSLLKTPLQVHPYPAGTWGPPEFDRLVERGGHHWFPL